MAGPRVLLSQLRSLMAGEGAPQGRLDSVTEIIATNMTADVCSLYLRRAGDVIVWDNQAAVHRATEFDTTHHQRLMQRTTISSGIPVAT